MKIFLQEVHVFYNAAPGSEFIEERTEAGTANWEIPDESSFCLKTNTHQQNKLFTEK